ncbi:SprT-like domain-containing protein [Halalkalicoccus tibetensis]|uniref:SprT-like domain-containing protein n=1 Tax=Halalkalicoccus tibetensis TaxID=175632 RepID=A0ABD5V538_9EURY
MSTDEPAVARRGDTIDDGTHHPRTKGALRERAAAHAAAVGAEHFPLVPVEEIEWEVSTRMKRSAGIAVYDRDAEQVTIRLSWDAYEAYGWEEFARTVRHELIHAWQYYERGTADHGPTFRQWLDPLDTDRHCERYAEPRYWIVCEDCGDRNPRYRRSKVVERPERYSCGRCGGPIAVRPGN